jgi:hypothetical protein
MRFGTTSGGEGTRDVTHTIRLRAGVMAVVAVVIGMLAMAVAAATSSSAAETTTTSFVTGYSYYDNSPPGNVISNPVLHQGASGVGTYADPITVAVGIVNGAPMITSGTRFYIPNLRRYFMVEDTCAACATNVPSGAAFWIDVWVDGSTTTTSAANSCMNAITGNWKVIQNPSSNYVVVSGALSKASGCAAQYGNTTLLATPPPIVTTTPPPIVTTTPPPIVTTTPPPIVTTTPPPTTAPKATSLSCPVVTAPTVGQVVSCSYH